MKAPSVLSLILVIMQHFTGKLCTCDVSKVLKIMFSPNPYQVIQLRKACSHPYLFTGIEPEPYEEGEHLVQVIENLGLL
ncbi:hypothetical protein BHE74_00024127 [Ensete ventricosum]|uniref:SNF2 N-terminal domain-containing protein n=1 Tax=Ensete ventricosum TaxID=4639 RepID=A0A427ATP5_ENSVE|nr:hypothetical protein B296_00003306 [Ensete ventricosum]RWW68345.1 hypothetical protein BHE74_00024127 [Ensete ventricosum]RZR80386.1 hypothetical protein BHM03_00006415 [Ensete ventricosum]